MRRAAASTWAGGLYRQTTDGTLTLQNTIVTGNFRGAGTTAADVTGAITGTYNLFGTGGSGTLSGGTGNLHNVADARLGPLVDNGGPVLTHALLSGSPALDAGSNALTAETADARGAGFARKLDAADADTVQTVDMGALEQHPAVEALPDRTMRNGLAQRRDADIDRYLCPDRPEAARPDDHQHGLDLRSLRSDRHLRPQ